MENGLLNDLVDLVDKYNDLISLEIIHLSDYRYISELIWFLDGL